MMQKPTISIFTGDTGHLSIAEAIHQSIPDRFYSTINNPGSKFFNLYTPFYLYAPQLFNLPFKISQNKSTHKFIRQSLTHMFQDYIQQTLDKQKPKIVISTWYPLNPLLEHYQKKYNYHFINIITDPYTVHSLNLTNAGINFVFDEHAYSICENMGIDPNLLLVSGWFVHPKYENKYSKNQSSHQLGLKPNIPTYTIAAGSEGTNLILKILPAFLNHRQEINVVFACGKNKHLFSIINHLNSIKSIASNKFRANLIPIRFTSKLHYYFHVSNLVIGKAGPNLIFESIASKTPFFAITHISGHEDGNLELIKKYNIGYVEENPFKANALINKIISNPSTLKQFQPNISKLRKHNLQSKTVLNNYLDNLN